MLFDTIISVETENRQLHQVIAQLRQVRRNNKEDVDTIVQERDELKNKLLAMDNELNRYNFFGGPCKF